MLALTAVKIYGTLCHMENTQTRKVTVHVPARLLESAQAATGKGVTETVKEALRQMAARKAGEELCKLRGKLDLQIDLKALRED